MSWLLDKMESGVSSCLTFSAKQSSSSREKDRQLFEGEVVGKSLTEDNLRKGDILIVKDFSAVGEDEDSDYIRGGQALFSRMRQGSSSSEHALIVAKDGASIVYESIGVGVVKRQTVSTRTHAVYRHINPVLGAHAVSVARFLCGDARIDGDKIFNMNEGQAANVSYSSKKGLARGITRLKYQGRGANKRIAKIQELYEAGNTDISGAGLHMNCAEFVATCYEVASSLSNPTIEALNIDPRAMTAKALEAVLKRKQWFELKGSYKGRINKRMHEQMQHAFVFGPLLHVGDRELMAGNTLEDVPRPEGLRIKDVDNQQIVSVVTFNNPFQLAAVNSVGGRLLEVQDDAKTSKFDYLITETPRVTWDEKHNTFLYIALKAPKRAADVGLRICT